MDLGARMLCLIVFFLGIRCARGYGYMSTMAALWGSTSSNGGRSFSVCSIDAGTGNPRCWGTFSVSNSSRPPANVSLWSLTGGAYFACGLTVEGHNPVCWGQTPGSVVPADFQKVRYSTINCGGWHVCAIRERSLNPSDEGTVDCWGNTDFRQCSPPITIPMHSITAGDYFTCGLTQYTGRVVCWGQMSSSNNDSALRNRYNQQNLFESISAGRTHVCGVVRKTHRVLCWGANDHGQCSPPTDVAFSAVVAGMYHSCGIRLDNHQAQCWGDNSLGQSEAPSGVAFALITAGDRYTCGVRLESPGSVDCWGNQVVAPSSSSLGFNTSQGLCHQSCDAAEFAIDGAGLGCKICPPCAQCGSGFFEAAPCAANRDAECSSCQSCAFHQHDRCSRVCERATSVARPVGERSPPRASNSTNSRSSAGLWKKKAGVRASVIFASLGLILTV